MVLITPEAESSSLRLQLSAIEDELMQLREDLAELRSQIQTGKPTSPQTALSLFSTIRAYMRMALETEARLAELNAKHSKIAQGGYAVDLDEARAQIRCRLAALRRCCTDGSGDQGA